MVKRIDHVSLAVNDYEKARVFFTDLLGLVPGAGGTDNVSGFLWQIFSVGDLSRFETISPLGKDSFLSGFLKGKGEGVHHITFQVEDIRETVRKLEYMGIPYFGLNDQYDGWKELFIHPRDAFGLLIQFAQFDPAVWIAKSLNLNRGEKWRITVAENMLHLKTEHPGGGTVDCAFDRDELDLLIAELSSARKKMK